MTKDGKINILVIPSDKYGCGFWRSVNPHTFLGINMKAPVIQSISRLPLYEPSCGWKDFIVLPMIGRSSIKNCQAKTFPRVGK